MDAASPEFVAFVERLVRAESGVRQAEIRLNAINGQISTLATQVSNLRVEQATTRARTAVMAAVGGAIGSAFVGAAFTLALKLILA